MLFLQADINTYNTFYYKMAILSSPTFQKSAMRGQRAEKSRTNVRLGMLFWA
jgi:hypothetical protein